MATWTKQQQHARREAQRRYRLKNNKPIKSRDQYWRERRLMNLLISGIIIPDIEEEK